MTGQTVDDALAALHASFETVISARTGAWAGALRLHEMRTRATVPGSTEALAEAKRELSRESSRLCETAEARLDVLLQSSLAASERKGTIETQPSKIPANACALRVFVSYSWDTEEHKKWALALANRLREHGIDAIIDQTHLSLGARSPEFMECSVRESGRVLVVCTEILTSDVLTTARVVRATRATLSPGKLSMRSVRTNLSRYSGTETGKVPYPPPCQEYMASIFAMTRLMNSVSS